MGNHRADGALTKKRMITKRPLIGPILTLMLGVKADQGPDSETANDNAPRIISSCLELKYSK